MRRIGPFLLVVLLIVGAGIGGYVYGTNKGLTSGKATAAADRSAFTLARGTVAAGAGGPAAQGRPSGSGGQGVQGSANAGRGVGGSAVAGTPSAGRGNTGQDASSGLNVTGKVAKLDSTTMTVQQADASLVTVATSTTTMVGKLVPGVLADLKKDDLVAVQGDKTSDTAYTARSIIATGSQPAGGANPGRGAGGASGGVSGGLFGRIMTVDTTGLTLQTLDGMTVTVATNASTTVRMQQTGTFSDIKSGDTVTVIGEKTGDAAYTARFITDLGAGG